MTFDIRSGLQGHSRLRDWRLAQNASYTEDAVILVQFRRFCQRDAASRGFSARAELVVIHQRLTTSFDDDFLVLLTRRRRRSKIAHFLSTGGARLTPPVRPSVARPYCRLALSAHYDSAIRRVAAVLRSQRERATKLMRQFNDGWWVACMQRRPSNGLIDI